MNKQKYNIILRLYLASKYSLNGLSHCIKTQFSFLIELLVVIILTPITLYLSISNTNKLILIFSSLLILITELINTAIEETVNYISQELNSQAKIIKDISSAAVFLSVILYIFLWIGTLIDKQLG